MKLRKSTTRFDARQFTITTDDDRGLHCRHWGPRDAREIFLVVHGLGEHSGCYDEFASAIAQHNRATYAFDQHGHGKSPGVRGHAPSLDHFIDDIQTVWLQVGNENPDAEVILLGHSMGGHFVLKFLLDKDRPPIDRAIVTNPMILPNNPPTKLQSLAAWLTSKIVPRLRVSASMDPTLLTQDKEMLKRLADDPLMHESLSIGVAGKLMSSGHDILERAGELETSLLFLIGEDDEICDRETSRSFCERSANSCTTKTFPGLRHALLIERDRQQVFDAITRWLDAR